MSKLRYHIAVMAAKFSKVIIRLSGRNGTHTPGVVARKICPDFMAQAPKAPLCICVTGTNGKTTVSNMLTDMLEKEGKKVVSNRTGSNIVPGCVTNLLNSVNWLGRCRVDATVFEVDERASRLILPYVKPDYLVVTNLFRDSLKRNAHPDYIFSVIDTYCPDTTKLILNADEQCSSNLKPNSEHVYFGIGKQDDDKTEPYNLIADYTLCPKCGTKLKFNYLRYHHIGNAYCPNCDYKSADADYLATKVDKEGKKLIVREKDGNEIEYALIHDALFNIYNELTVITMMRELGYSSDEIERTAEEREHLLAQVSEKAKKLSAARSQAAERFSKQVEEELNFLDMPGVKIGVAMEKGKLTAAGMDTVEFMISTNKGEGMKPMSKIASGGELSRIMLALKNVIAEKDDIHTLIFDEIDTGVSGRAAQKIGIKLKSVSKNQQVLCVTHLSQLAVMADNHLLIEKQTREGRTFTSVHKLDFEQRKREIARIMVGENITDTALMNAEEMLLAGSAE